MKTCHLSIAALTLIAGPLLVAAQQINDDVSVAARHSSDDVVVQGLPPRCRPRANDPQDSVNVSSAVTGNRRQQMIGRDPGTGSFALLPDDFPNGGPETWQRAGTRLRDFVFRTGGEGKPVCIGARGRFILGVGQLRRAFEARPYWGKYMILTASVAARRAGQVDMWIAAGANDPRPREDGDLGRDIVAGGFKRVPITGDYQWKQVNFLIGPIPCMAAAISYGVQLQGGGDVWLANAHFVEVPESSLSPSMVKARHGQTMLRDDPICRHYLAREKLYTPRDKLVVPLADDAPLYPGLALLRKVEGRFEPIRYDQSFAPGIIEF